MFLRVFFFFGNSGIIKTAWKKENWEIVNEIFMPVTECTTYGHRGRQSNKREILYIKFKLNNCG
jgi:hypothetical protein